MTIGGLLFGEILSGAAASGEEDGIGTIEMAGAIGDAVVFGPNYITDTNGDVITQPGDYPSTMSVEVVDLSALGTVISTLPYAFDRSFTDENNDTGSGSVSIANTDTAAAAAAELDRMITFSVEGQRAFSMIVESKTRVTISEGEEHDQITALAGRGHLSLLENAVLYPSRGPDVSPIEEDRTFNWSTPSTVYDDSGWARAMTIMSVGSAQVNWPRLPFAEGWTDLTTGVIWAKGSTRLLAPPGYCYFRKDVIVPNDGYYILEAACDNEGEMYLDGQKVLTLGTFTQTFRYLVYITQGPHTIAVWGRNYRRSDGSGSGPAGLVMALYEADSQGDPVLPAIFHTDNTWKIVAYPDAPPGMYVGHVLHTVFDEAIARGVYLFDQISLMFTNTVDSAGRPWPETLDIASKVGTTYLVFLIEQAVTYIDMWMKPGTLELYAWNKGTRNRYSGVSLHGPTDENDPESGNIYEQAHTIL